MIAALGIYYHRIASDEWNTVYVFVKSFRPPLKRTSIILNLLPTDGKSIFPSQSNVFSLLHPPVAQPLLPQPETLFPDEADFTEHPPEPHDVQPILSQFKFLG